MNTACATPALSSSERFTTVTSFSSMRLSAFRSFCVTHPITRSICRTLVESFAIESPVAPSPGLKSPPICVCRNGVFTEGALM